MSQKSLFQIEPSSQGFPLLQKISDTQFRLLIKVTPKSKAPGVKGIFLGQTRKMLIVHSSCPPENNKANQDVVKILAKFLGISASAIALESGSTFRQKSLIITWHNSESALIQKLDPNSVTIN